MGKKDPIKEHLEYTEKGRLDKSAGKLKDYLTDKRKKKDVHKNLKKLQREYMQFCKRHPDVNADEYMQIIDDVVNRINE